jgi:hypothetical protein
MSDVRVLASDETFLSAIYRNVVVTAWSGPPTLAKLESVGDAQRQANRRCANGFVAISLIRHISLKMSPEIRVAAERLSKEPPHGLRAVAQVVYGTGFASATMRSVVTGFQLITRRDHPMKVFADLDAAAEWLEPTVRELDPRTNGDAASLARGIRAAVTGSWRHSAGSAW